MSIIKTNNITDNQLFNITSHRNQTIYTVNYNTLFMFLSIGIIVLIITVKQRLSEIDKDNHRI